MEKVQGNPDVSDMDSVDICSKVRGISADLQILEGQENPEAMSALPCGSKNKADIHLEQS